MAEPNDDPVPEITLADLALLRRMVKATTEKFAGGVQFTPDDRTPIIELYGKIERLAPEAVQAEHMASHELEDCDLIPVEREPDRYDSPPRETEGEPRHGDAFTVHERKAPMTVEALVRAYPPQKPGDGPSYLVRAADGNHWVIFPKPLVEGEAPFPRYHGIRMHPGMPGTT
jgi:hypothetical protein